MSDVGCWMSDVGCRMSDVGCRMSDVGCWMLDVGCRMLDVGCWMLQGRYTNQGKQLIPVCAICVFAHIFNLSDLCRSKYRMTEEISFANQGISL